MALDTAEPVTARAEAEAVPEPAFSLVQVPQPGHTEVGVAEAESRLGFRPMVAGPLGQRESLLEMTRQPGSP